MRNSLRQMMQDSFNHGKNPSNDLNFPDWYEDYIAKQSRADRRFTDDQIKEFRLDCTQMLLTEACLKHGINYNTGHAIRNYKTYKDVETK